MALVGHELMMHEAIIGATHIKSCHLTSCSLQVSGAADFMMLCMKCHLLVFGTAHPASMHWWCRLDLGDAPYAATFYIDERDRAICWVWLRDPPPADEPLPAYSGCLGIPRVVTCLPQPGASGAINGTAADVRTPHDVGTNGNASSSSAAQLLHQAPALAVHTLRGRCLWQHPAAEGAAAWRVSGVQRLPCTELQNHVNCELHLYRCRTAHLQCTWLAFWEARRLLCMLLTRALPGRVSKCSAHSIVGPVLFGWGRGVLLDNR